MGINYTAVVNVTGEGRNGGHVLSNDGILETTLGYPKEMGGAGDASNPEQLFAAGWGACFLGAVRLVAGQREIKLTSTAINTEITLAQNESGDLDLAAILNVEIGGVDQDTATALTEAAHQVCPYSRATRGNVPVTINTTAV